MKRIRCDRTAAWGVLYASFVNGANTFDARQAFANDPERFARLSQVAPHIFADLSKNLLDAETEALLQTLARECGLEAHRDAMFAGDAINTTENRAVMHWLLRYPPLAPVHAEHSAIKNVVISSFTDKRRDARSRRDRGGDAWVIANWERVAA